MGKGSGRLGILTAGGDCQGLNAAVRAVVMTATRTYGMEVIGFHDGFIGLEHNRYQSLTAANVSGILGLGGTILGTGRGSTKDSSSLEEVTQRCYAHYRELGLDVLVCLGGDGTQRFSRHLAGNTDMRIITLPKTIDNDIKGTDACFGFDTATQIAAEAIDRLHTTASSHHRIMLVEVMGRNAGWLAAASGLAGEADAVIIPEIPYRVDELVEALQARRSAGRHYAVVVVAEGAMSDEEARSGQRPKLHAAAVHLVDELEARTGMETRLTSLGHVMRGGSPTATDRILATEFGTRAVELVDQGVFGVMVAKRSDRIVPVPLAEVAGQHRPLPLDHGLVRSLALQGTFLGAADACTPGHSHGASVPA